MLQISEWLPNPTGNDALGEWVELYNSGQEPLQIGGYRIIASKGKAYVFGPQTLLANQYLLLPREASKLTLRNTDESLTLYSVAGEVVDTSKFVGSAPEGKSFNRVNTSDQAPFLFSAPTPGAPNQVPTMSAVASVSETYPLNTPLHASVSVFELILASIALGIGLSLAITTIIQRNADLQKLFFR